MFYPPPPAPTHPIPLPTLSEINYDTQTGYVQSSFLDRLQCTKRIMECILVLKGKELMRNNVTFKDVEAKHRVPDDNDDCIQCRAVSSFSQCLAGVESVLSMRIV